MRRWIFDHGGWQRSDGCRMSEELTETGTRRVVDERMVCGLPGHAKRDSKEYLGILWQRSLSEGLSKPAIVGYPDSIFQVELLMWRLHSWFLAIFLV